MHIELVLPKPDEWRRRFERHRARLHQLWPTADVQHIGSTAIGGLQAKDVVDILVGVSGDELTHATLAFSREGYRLEGQRDAHAWLCWPSPEQREAVIHVMELGGESWRKRLTFRDYLREHPEYAQQYEQLKRPLATQTSDWGEYTQAKAGFVARIIALADAPSR